MASFALLPIFSGFSFDLPEKSVGFHPLLPGDFRAPWFLDCAWGEFVRTGDTTTLTVFDGALPLRTLALPYLKNVRAVTADGADVPFSFKDGQLSLDLTLKGRLVIKGEA